MSIYFEKVSKYNDWDLPMPERKTKYSAGYDFASAEDVVIPSYTYIVEAFKNEVATNNIYSLNDMAKITKEFKLKPTLVPTGMKCHMENGQFLELSVRSSLPLKYWIIMANGVGIIDADYYNNPDNEGHIYFQLINLSPFDIEIAKGDIIGQGVIRNYLITDDDKAEGTRIGGFGSTSKDANN